MTCEKIQERLYEFLFDLLEPEQRREVASHLETCEACRKVLEQAARERGLLRHWAVAPPAGLADTTIASVQAAARRRQAAPPSPYAPVEPAVKWLGSRRFWTVAAAAAAVVLAVVGVQSLVIALRTAAPQEAFVYSQACMTPGQAAPCRVFVRNGRTAEPVAGAVVHTALVSKPGDTVWQARLVTDEHGFAEIEAAVPEGAAEGAYSLKVVARSEAGESAVSRPIEVKRSFRVLVTTDKPIYQPGQVIHIRTLSLATADLRPVEARDVGLEVQDAKGNKVFKKVLQTSDYGIAAADFILADQVNTGDYTIAATLGDTTSERTVRVEPYVLPKFRVTLATDRGFYMPGEVLQGDLTAEYTFGKPVAKGQVKIVLSEFIHEFQPFATASGKTDAEGRFHFAIPLKTHFVGQELKKGDAFISLEATVTDAADHSEKKTLDRTVTTAPIRVEVFPESGRLVQGVENILYIVTAYPDGRPAKTHLRLGATRQETDTSDVGIAKVKITPTAPSLQLTITAEDKSGQRIRVTRDLRVGTPDESILVRTDRAVYRTGETVQVTLLSADRTGRVFLDVVKDRRTSLVKTIDVRDGVGTLALDLPPDLFGTLELHAYRIMQDGNIVGDARVIQVNRADDLRIKASLDKETYRPAEKALLDFVVTRADGTPTQAALSLAGVDEAVFALQEARPGLERIYFMLQEEILKPRYEIHATMPTTPEEAVREELGPTPERQEATVVLFSAAKGGEPPARAASESFTEKQSRFARENARHWNILSGAGALVPFGLFVALVLPILLYATLRLWRRQPIGGSRQAVHEFQGALRHLTRWWVLGLYLPVVVGIAVALLASRHEEVAGLFTGLCTCALAAGIQFVWATRVRQTEASHAVPLLRRLVAALPVAYLAATAAALLILLASNHGVLSEGTALVLSLTLGVLAVAVVGALSIAHHCAAEPVSVGRWFWLALSRPFFTALPAVLMGALLIPASFCALEKASSVRLIQAVGPARFDLSGGPVAARETLAAVAEKVAPLKVPTRIRRYFPETLLWNPQLITDEDGRARLEVPLADSITTWRIAMSGVSKRGELGAGAVPLRVFQDFFVDLDLPVALTQNDLVSVPVAVYNYLDRPQTVRLEVAPADWFELLDNPAQTIQMPAREVRAVHFRIRAIKPGRHAFFVKALGSELTDAVERQVAVRPDGQEVVETINGRLGRNLVHEILIPDDAIAGASDFLVKIYPGAFSQVVEGLDSIFRMPFGCFEQTSSTTYPNILVLDYMRRTNQVKPDIEMKALNFINLGYQRLLSYEVKGGGFEWFGHEPAHLVLTAYGLMEFSDMARVYSVDPAVIERTREWLYSKQKGDGSWPPPAGGLHEGAINRYQGQALQTTAYVAWALAESGNADARLGRAMDFIAREARKDVDTYTVALGASALTAAGRPESKAWLAELDARKVVEGDLVHWTSAGEGATFSRGDVLDIETTALAAYAFLKAGHEVSAAHKALAWLIVHKDPGGTWHSTQATVLAMRALLLGTGTGGPVEARMNVTVTANGKVAEALAITPETSDVFRLINLRPYVHEGKNTVALEASGQGNLAYQIVATHYVPWPKAAPPAVQQELSIDVAHDTTTLKTDDLLTARVTIRYNRPGSARMTIVDLGIPPGFEVLPDAFEKLKSQGVVERFSVTGRQVILYFREIPGGKPIAFVYRLRAKFPVKVKTPPTTVYQYYEPSLRAEARPAVLTVL